MLDFRLLGPLEVVGESGPLPLGGQRQRALLALLLLNANRVVSTDRLIDQLWGEQPPRTATASLQNSVSQLRKLLGPKLLVTRPPGYVLAVDPEQVDLSRFERAVRDARNLEAAERSRALRRALALWRGQPLAEIAFEAFASDEARRLDELRVSVLEERIEADLELGRHAEVAAELESLVAAHPLRERLRGQLMLALYRAGRQAEALRVYHEAREVLVDQLGIEPSRFLQDLQRAILRQEASLITPSADPDFDHYGEAVRALLGGRLVVVLGVAAAADEERNGATPEPRGPPVPGAAEIAAHLAGLFQCPPEHERDLTRVSQYVALTRGVGPLYDELHALLDLDFEPGPVRRFLARLPNVLRERDAPQLLVVTASFDRTLERAFEEVGEEVDVVSYVASGGNRGKFVHIAADGAATVVDLPNIYTEVAPERRTVILKIHGHVDLDPARSWESLVVSEDDYIDYLARADISNLIPVTLAAKLRRSHFLFLGYGVLEWSFRVFLQRVWGDDQLSYRSWAVQPGAAALEREYWRRRRVDLLDAPIAEYVRTLAARLEETPVSGRT